MLAPAMFGLGLQFLKGAGEPIAGFKKLAFQKIRLALKFSEGWKEVCLFGFNRTRIKAALRLEFWFQFRKAGDAVNGLVFIDKLNE